MSDKDQSKSPTPLTEIVRGITSGDESLGVFNLTDDSDDTLIICGFRVSGITLACVFFAFVGYLISIHWVLNILNWVRAAFFFTVANLCYSGRITFQTRSKLENYFRPFFFLFWCYCTGGLSSLYLKAFLLHPMTIGFSWYYTRLYVITLVFLYLFHFSEVLRPITLVDPGGYESLYANIGLVIYVVYLAKKFYTHATGVRHSVGTTPSEDSSSAQRDIRKNANRKSKQLNKTRYLSYYLTFMGLGIFWLMVWNSSVLGDLDPRMNALNYLYVLTMIVISQLYYAQKFKHNYLKKLSFCATVTAVMLYCFFSGGVNSPFLLFILSLMFLFSRQLFNLQFSFVVLFLLHTISSFLDDSYYCDFAIIGRDTLYKINFALVSFCACYYIYFYRTMVESEITLGPNSVLKKLEIGKEVCSFNPEKVLGKGGYGTVYAGVYNKKKVAVKIVKYEIGHRLIMREMKLLESFDCPNIVKVYGSKVFQDHKVVLVMELCRSDLVKYMREEVSHKFTQPLALSFAIDIAKGLEYLHSKSTIHRDLKCANILIHVPEGTKKPICKLADFGTGIVLQERENRATSSMPYSPSLTNSLMSLRGTIWYMAPEFSKESSLASYASDIYAFGIILWEIYNTLACRCYSHPYSDRKQLKKDDFQTLIYVALGNRPAIPIGFPVLMKELYLNAVDTIPENRMTAAKIASKLIKWKAQNLCQTWEYTTKSQQVLMEKID